MINIYNSKNFKKCPVYNEGVKTEGSLFICKNDIEKKQEALENSWAGIYCGLTFDCEVQIKKYLEDKLSVKDMTIESESKSKYLRVVLDDESDLIININYEKEINIKTQINNKFDFIYFNNDLIVRREAIRYINFNYDIGNNMVAGTD